MSHVLLFCFLFLALGGGDGGDCCGCGDDGHDGVYGLDCWVRVLFADFIFLVFETELVDIVSAKKDPKRQEL